MFDELLPSASLESLSHPVSYHDMAKVVFDTLGILAGNPDVISEAVSADELDQVGITFSPGRIINQPQDILPLISDIS